MHRLFTVSDVLSQICDILLEESDSASVSRLARTNKTLSLPCFAALWRNLDCIYPLLNALPSTVVDLSSRWRLRRHPTLADWRRPFYYGSFVRSIAYDPHRSRRYGRIIYDSQRGRYHRSFFHDLLASLRIRPGPGPSPGAIQLLPNLTHANFTWRLSSPESVIACNFFFAPTLISATMDSTADPTYALEHQHRAVFAEWFAALHSRCPLLEEIHCQARWSAIMALRPAVEVQTTLPHFPSLRALTAVLPGEYTVRFVMAAATQPLMKRLRFKFTTNAVMPSSLAEESFPCLETLELEGYNQKVCEFLALLAPRPPMRLTSLTLTCLSLEQPAFEFFQTVSRAAPAQTLLYLSLYFHPNYESTARMTVDDLSPLFKFDELRELRIQAGNPLHIGSGALATIGAAFPVLRVLCLNSPNTDEAEGGASAGGISASSFPWSAVVELARTCPLLRELSLPLDFDYLPSIYSPRSSIDHHSDVPRSSPPTATEAETFPNLESFLLNDIPPSSHIPNPMPSPIANIHPLTAAALPHSAVAIALPSSRSTRNSILNPQYAVLSMLADRMFPRAKLGLHVSRFELHEEQQRRERFERIQLRATPGPPRLRKSAARS